MTDREAGVHWWHRVRYIVRSFRDWRRPRRRAIRNATFEVHAMGRPPMTAWPELEDKLRAIDAAHGRVRRTTRRRPTSTLAWLNSARASTRARSRTNDAEGHARRRDPRHGGL